MSCLRMFFCHNLSLPLLPFMLWLVNCLNNQVCLLKIMLQFFTLAGILTTFWLRYTVLYVNFYYCNTSSITVTHLCLVLSQSLQGDDGIFAYILSVQSLPFMNYRYCTFGNKLTEAHAIHLDFVIIICGGFRVKHLVNFRGTVCTCL